MSRLFGVNRTWNLAYALVAAAVVVPSLIACSETSSASANNADGGGGGGGGGDGGDNGGPPIYLYQIAVYGPTETLQYDLLRHTLDFNITVDDLKTAREFSGYTGIAVIGGNVIAGDSETPFATKYSIGDDLSWTQIGEPLNFNRYFTADGDGLNFYYQALKGSDMYFFHGADRSARVHWNVDRWTVENQYVDTKLPTREGWTLRNTGNRTGARDFVGPVMQSFTLVETATEKVSNESWIAVYDPATHAEKAVIEVPCPGMEQVTLDEQGNAYFSTTNNTPTFALYNLAPASCVVKVKPDGTLDDTFPANDLKAWTGGFMGVNFRYIGNGKAVANVLHHDRIAEANWDGPLDPAVQTRIEGSWSETGSTPQDATLWELHLIDMATGTSQIITGFDAEHDLGSYTIFHQLDGRIFIAVQFDVNSVTNNAMYELDVATGTVKSAGSLAGDLFGVMRVR